MNRRLRLAGNPRTWSALASDARWRRGGPCPDPSVAQDGGPRAVVRWPVRYEHPIAGGFVREIKDGFAAVASVVPADIDQPYEGIVLIEVDCEDGPRRVAIDYYDFTFVNARCAEEVHTYFKFQHLRGGYPDFPNVEPGGYVTTSPFLYSHWCRLRALRRGSTPTSDAFARFGLRFSAPVRERALQLLGSDRRLAYAGGSRPTNHTLYLREMARARVCVDLPGQGPFCCRMVEGLAMGCCMIGPRHATELPDDLRDGVSYVYCRDDLSDLVDLCAAHARDDAKRAVVEAGAARYFDEILHPVRLAERYLRIAREGGSVGAV
jgi:hypothetical protein